MGLEFTSTSALTETPTSHRNCAPPKRAHCRSAHRPDEVGLEPENLSLLEDKPPVRRQAWHSTEQERLRRSFKTHACFLQDCFPARAHARNSLIPTSGAIASKPRLEGVGPLGEIREARPGGARALTSSVAQINPKL